MQTETKHIKLAVEVTQPTTTNIEFWLERSDSGKFIYLMAQGGTGARQTLLQIELSTGKLSYKLAAHVKGLSKLYVDNEGGI